MKTLIVRTTIASDGSIDLHVPTDLPPSDAEVVLVVQPIADSAPGQPVPPFPSDRGVWRGILPDGDIDADLRGMSREWEKRLESPE